MKYLTLLITIINYFPVTSFELVETPIPIPCTYTNNHVVLSCNCNFAQQIMEMPPHNGSIHYIQISNCDTLILRPSIFSQISDLQWIKLYNILNLEIGEKSFQFRNDPVELRFENVQIQSVPSYAFIGKIDDLHFINCTIDEFQEFSVSGIGTRMNQLVIKESNIKVIKPQAFKKFAVESFLIENTNFLADLPSKAFYQLEITDTFTIQNSVFQSLYPNSIYVTKTAKMRIWFNSFHIIEAEAFNITIKTSFEMEHNNLTALHNLALTNIHADNVLTVWEKIHQPRFIFRNNSFDNIDSDFSINPSSNFNSKISEIHVIQPKTCDFVLNAADNDFIKNVSHEIFIRTNSDPKTPITLSQYEEEHCKENSFIVYGIIGIVFLSTALVIIVICVIIYFHRERQKIIQARMVSPEPRTYRETHIVMQVETHNLMKTDF